MIFDMKKILLKMLFEYLDNIIKTIILSIGAVFGLYIFLIPLHDYYPISDMTFMDYFCFCFGGVMLIQMTMCTVAFVFLESKKIIEYKDE